MILVSEMLQPGFFTDFIEKFHKIIVWCACVIYCNDWVLKGSNCLIICLFLEDVFILTFPYLCECWWVGSLCPWPSEQACFCLCGWLDMYIWYWRRYQWWWTYGISKLKPVICWNYVWLSLLGVMGQWLLLGILSKFLDLSDNCWKMQVGFW